MKLLRRLFLFKINIKLIPFGIRIVPLILILIFSVIALSGAFYYKKVSSGQVGYTQKIVEEVGKLIDLPEETPSIATVNDPERLKSGQSGAFFKNAKKGDLLLIFTRSRKIVLYRPSEKKVIDVANATLAVAQPSITPQAQSLRFAIYNGTTTGGVSGKT